MVQVTLVLPCIVFCIRHISCNKEGECFRNKTFIEGSDIKFTERFCCDNYEDKNGTCIECSKGYTSKQGIPCEPCPLLRYGKKCVETCECIIEKCDHVTGCFNELSSYNGTTGIQETPVFLQTSSMQTIADIEEHNDTLLIYVICAGAMTILIAITAIIMKHQRKKTKINPTVRYQLNNNENSQTQDIPDELYTTIV